MDISDQVSGMSAHLRHYLRQARDSVLRAPEGTAEHDAFR